MPHTHMHNISLSITHPYSNCLCTDTSPPCSKAAFAFFLSCLSSTFCSQWKYLRRRLLPFRSLLQSTDVQHRFSGCLRELWQPTSHLPSELSCSLLVHTLLTDKVKDELRSRTWPRTNLILFCIYVFNIQDNILLKLLWYWVSLKMHSFTSSSQLDIGIMCTYHEVFFNKR